MPTSVEKLRSERRRKLLVRDSFMRSLDFFRNSAADPRPFYLACGDYLAAGQRRLIDQDTRLVDMLSTRVPAAHQADHEAIKALRERLARAERSLGEFQVAVEDLRKRGAAARGAFEQAAARFVDFLVNVLGARSHSLRHLTSTLLDEDDWRRIVDATPQFLEEEARAFGAISRLAPAGLGPEEVAGESAPG